MNQQSRIEVGFDHRAGGSGSERFRNDDVDSADYGVEGCGGLFRNPFETLRHDVGGVAGLASGADVGNAPQLNVLSRRYHAVKVQFLQRQILFHRRVRHDRDQRTVVSRRAPRMAVRLFDQRAYRRDAVADDVARAAVSDGERPARNDQKTEFPARAVLFDQDMAVESARQPDRFQKLFFGRRIFKYGYADAVIGEIRFRRAFAGRVHAEAVC